MSAEPHLATDSCGQKADRSVPFRVVGCGRLSAEKDWSTLIRAMARCDREKAITCHLIGSGSMREQLSEEIRQLGCEDRIHLTGALTHEETLRQVAAADLFVLPSRFEGFGIAAVEAMALGVPTVTSDFPASHEYIVPGKTGHQFPIGDSESLAGLINWHFRNRDQSRHMGRVGQATIGEAYSAERNAQLHLQLYLQ